MRNAGPYFAEAEDAAGKDVPPQGLLLFMAGISVLLVGPFIQPQPGVYRGALVLPAINDIPAVRRCNRHPAPGSYAERILVLPRRILR
jgi:hypothetical protein